MEANWNVPESQRTPIMYDTISEAKSLDNARLRLAQDYAGEDVSFHVQKSVTKIMPKQKIR